MVNTGFESYLCIRNHCPKDDDPVGNSERTTLLYSNLVVCLKGLLALGALFVRSRYCIVLAVAKQTLPLVNAASDNSNSHSLCMHYLADSRSTPPTITLVYCCFQTSLGHAAKLKPHAHEHSLEERLSCQTTLKDYPLLCRRCIQVLHCKPLQFQEFNGWTKKNT